MWDKIMKNGIGIILSSIILSVPHDSPGGATKNSPVIDRWVPGPHFPPSPEGAIEECFTEANEDNEEGKSLVRSFVQSFVSFVTFCSKSHPCNPCNPWLILNFVFFVRFVVLPQSFLIFN